MNKRRNKRKKGLGIFLISIGLLGIILPILPGWLFIISGFSMTSPKFSKKLVKTNVRYRCHKNGIKYLKDVIKDIKDSIKKR